MIFKNIVTKKQYEKDGKPVVKWLNCGTLRVNDDGKSFIEMNHCPETTFFVFDQKTNEKEAL